MSNKRKARAPITVVAAPSSFPDFSSFSSVRNKKPKRGSSSNHNNNNNNNDHSKKGIEIDFDTTVQEIKELGSSQFTGKQKRKYEEEQYKALTGREKKHHKVPLKIVRGIKKKAAMRERRREEEVRESGVVSGDGIGSSSSSSTRKKKKERRGFSEQKRRDARIHGPAPDIGYTKRGVLSVRKERR